MDFIRRRPPLRFVSMAGQRRRRLRKQQCCADDWIQNLPARRQPVIKRSSGDETPLSRLISCSRGDASRGEFAFALKNRSVVARPSSGEATVSDASSVIAIVFVFEMGLSRSADRCSRAGTLVGSASLSTGDAAFSSFVQSTMRLPMAATTTSDGPCGDVKSAFTAS
jgi:hypothetical protein